MDEVYDLLNAWGLPELKPIFTKNEINLQALAALTTEDIKEIIPQLGPRALFVRCWRAWASDQTGPSLEISNLSILHDIPVLFEDFLQSGSEPPSGSSRPPSESSGPPSASSYINKDQQTSPNTSSLSDLENNALLELLQNNFETTGLLRFKGKSLDNENARNLLAATISKEILKENKNAPITGNVYNKWVKHIKGLFPGERATTYYISPCVTAQGITHQARGKLVSQLMNIRRKYQKLGVLDTKKILIRGENQQQSSSLLIRPIPLSINNAIQTNKNPEEDLAWLKSCSDPWELVESKWKATLLQRSRDIARPEYSIEQYFDDYPALQKPQGYKLLVEDFNNSYPDNVNNFYLHFPGIKNRLIELLLQKEAKEDTYLEQLIHLAKDSSEDKKNLAAILSLPELISPSVVALPGQPTTSTPRSSSEPPAAKRKRGKDKRWKPSKAESREAFVHTVYDDSYLKMVIHKRHEKLTEKGFTPQPYIVTVGPTLLNVKSYYVVVNPKIFYDCANILAAIDLCFKITWSLNLEYSPSSYGCWFFLQKGLYKLSSAFDKGSTSVESLLTDCNLFT